MGSVCLEAGAKGCECGEEGGVSDEWEDRSAALLFPLVELPIMLCMPCQRTLYGCGFGAGSLTHLPTAIRTLHYLFY